MKLSEIEKSEINLEMFPNSIETSPAMINCDNEQKKSPPHYTKAEAFKKYDESNFSNLFFSHFPFSTV